MGLMDLLRILRRRLKRTEELLIMSPVYLVISSYLRPHVAELQPGAERSCARMQAPKAIAPDRIYLDQGGTVGLGSTRSSLVR